MTSVPGNVTSSVKGGMFGSSFFSGWTAGLNEEVLHPNRRPGIHDHERAVPANYLAYLCVGFNASLVVPCVMRCLRIL